MWLLLLVTALFAIGLPLALLNECGASGRGRAAFAVLALARLAGRGCLSVSRRGTSVTLCSDGLNRRVAGCGAVGWELVQAEAGEARPPAPAPPAPTTVAARLAAWFASALALATGAASLSITVADPYIDWTHGPDGTLHLVRLLRDAGLVGDAQGPVPPTPLPHAPPAPAATVASSVIALEGRVAAGPVTLRLVSGRLLVPELVGRVLGGHAAVDASLTSAGALALSLTSPAAEVGVRGRLVRQAAGGGLVLSLDAPVRVALTGLDPPTGRALLGAVHPLLGNTLSASAAGGGGSGGGSPARPITALLMPSGGGTALPCPALDVAVSPLALAVAPTGVLGDVAAALGFGGGGGGGSAAAGPNLTLATVGPLRVTVFRGGSSVVMRRLDATLALAIAGGQPAPPASLPARLASAAAALAAPPPVRLSLWGTVTPTALDCRVGVPVAALSGTALGRAVAAGAAGPGEVVSLALTGPPAAPRLDWRAAARELPTALVGGRVRAAAGAALEEALTAAAPPWLAGLAATAAAAGRREREKGAAVKAAPAATAPPADDRFAWEIDGVWGDEPEGGQAAPVPAPEEGGPPTSGGSTPVLVPARPAAPPAAAPVASIIPGPPAKEEGGADPEWDEDWVALDAATGGWA